MEARTENLRNQYNQAVLSVVLAIALALCMLPISSIKAFAKTTNQSYVYEHIYKTYVYDYMYGTYNNEYALGFKSYYGLIEQVDVVNANRGVTLSIENYGYTNPYWLTSWIYGLTQASVPDVVGMPSRSGKAIKYTPFRLSGEKLSNVKYDKVVYFNSKQIAGGKGTALFKASKTTCLVDVYNNHGKKVQSIRARTKKGETGDIEYQNDKIYLNIRSAWYVLKKGKFTKSKKPASKYSYSENYPLLQNEVIYKSDGTSDTDFYQQWYLLNKNGTRINLPFNDGAYYVQVNDLGVYCIDNSQRCLLYSNKGKLLATIDNASNVNISESAIPKVFVLYKNGKPEGAYNSSFKLITRTKTLVERYANCWFAGTYKGQKIYAARAANKQMQKNMVCVFLKKNMRPLKIRNYCLIGKINNTLSAPQDISLRKAYVGMNSQGRFNLINSKGKQIIAFSFTNFDVRENTRYALVANGKKWSFIPLRK